MEQTIADSIIKYHSNPPHDSEIVDRWKLIKKDITLEQAIKCEILAIDELAGGDSRFLKNYLDEIGLFMKGFKRQHDGNWECYDKEYKTFRLVVSRHWRDNEEDAFNVTCVDNEDCDLEVIIATNVDLDWVKQFDELLEKNPSNKNI